MTCMSVIHGDLLFSLHCLCTVSFQCSKFCVLFGGGGHTHGSSHYTFQIFTPAKLGTYGLKATEVELIFEVSQLWRVLTATSTAWMRRWPGTLKPLSHWLLTRIRRKVLHQGQTQVCCIHTCILIRIKCGLNLNYQSGSMHPCEMGFR